MSTRLSWQLISIMFVVLVVGVFVVVDISRAAGFVLLFIALGIGLVARLGHEARRRRG
ncbi:MAG TPA: hypothetical protein VMA77_32765 [Solirubrobacteraceae bacterium]|nr:hypothetical protein [Solirubrobacteraceae bacterium]